MSEVVEILRETTPNWKEIRQIVTNSNINSYEDIFHYLYDKADVYLPGKEGSVAVIINEH